VARRESRLSPIAHRPSPIPARPVLVPQPPAASPPGHRPPASARARRHRRRPNAGDGEKRPQSWRSTGPSHTRYEGGAGTATQRRSSIRWRPLIQLQRGSQSVLTRGIAPNLIGTGPESRSRPLLGSECVLCLRGPCGARRWRGTTVHPPPYQRTHVPANVPMYQCTRVRPPDPHPIRAPADACVHVECRDASESSSLSGLGAASPCTTRMAPSKEVHAATPTSHGTLLDDVSLTIMRCIAMYKSGSVPQIQTLLRLQR
jgi:hypothetical protein